MSKNTTDELDELLGKLIFDVHKSASNGETIDKVMVLSLKTKQAIQAHVDNKVVEARIDEINNTEVWCNANCCLSSEHVLVTHKADNPQNRIIKIIKGKSK